MQGGVMRRRKQAAGIIKPIEINKSNAKGEEEAELLSPGSIAFHTEKFNVHILAIMGCKTSLNLEVAKAKLPNTLLKHPRFSSIVVGDPSKGEQLRWLRTEVDLDKHIIIPEINQNNIESPDKFVEDYIHNLTKTSLDMSRPLWDLHILHVKTSEEVEGIGIFRIHHSLGDGISLISLLLALTRKISDPQALPTIPVHKKRDNSKKNRKWLIWRCVLALWWVLQLSWNTVIDVAVFIATTMFLKDTNTPLKATPGTEFGPRRIVYKMVNLDDMKLVKNAMNATINDVALGITQAGLSRYLNRKYAIDGNNKESAIEESSKLPKHIRLRSSLLINIRPASGIQALADMMENDTEAKWGNAIGYVLLPFTIGLRKDPLDYIREAKSAVDRKKHSLEVVCTYFIAKFVMKFLGDKAAKALSYKIHSHTTMAFSNMVGPLEEIGFYGHQMAFLAPTTYGQPQALMIHFQSYVNKMTIVLSVNEDVIPDPHQLCDDIIHSLNIVKNAIVARVGDDTKVCL